MSEDLPSNGTFFNFGDDPTPATTESTDQNIDRENTLEQRTPGLRRPGSPFHRRLRNGQGPRSSTADLSNPASIRPVLRKARRSSERRPDLNT
jgi:hypothetical protein